MQQKEKGELKNLILRDLEVERDLALLPEEVKDAEQHGHRGQIG
jgi:hypothetical protein